MCMKGSAAHNFLSSLCLTCFKFMYQERDVCFVIPAEEGCCLVLHYLQYGGSIYRLLFICVYLDYLLLTSSLCRVQGTDL